MNYVKLLPALLRAKNALKKDEILLHPTKWKTASIVVTSLVSAGMVGREVACLIDELCYGITQDRVNFWSSILGIVFFAGFQIYTVIATTKTMGSKSRETNAGDSITNSSSTELLPDIMPEVANKPVSAYGTGDKTSDNPSDYDKFVGGS